MIRLPSALAALWRSLFDNTQHPARYLTRALLVDLPVTLTIGVLVYLVAPAHGPDFSKQSLPALLFGLCVLSPVVETLMMTLLFFVLRLVVRRFTHLAMLSTFCWAGLHSLSAPVWGLAVFWPFLILSICYLTWEAKSRRHAIYLTALLHACHNLLPAIAIIAGRYLS